MAEAGAHSSNIDPLPSVGERVALLLASCLASFSLFLDFWRPEFLSHRGLLLLCGFSLSLSLALWLRRTIAASSMGLFLPALPLAFCVLFQEGESAGATALAATAFAFQARLLLLYLAMGCQRSRLVLASALENRMPAEGMLFVDNDIQSLSKIENIHEGHLVRVENGQKIPVDGVVTYGSGVVDESLEEGEKESLEVKGTGSLLFAGMRHKNGPLLLRAMATGKNTFASRMAARARSGSEVHLGKALLADCALFAAALSALALTGPALSLRLFLLGSSATCVAFLSRFELGLAESSRERLWLWRPGGLRRISRFGMLMLRGPGVLFEGRPRLAAVESVAPLSQDAALTLLAPLARKLETPAANSLLRELRLRNIPLKQLEHFSLLGDRGIALLEGEEIRWTPLPASHLTPETLGPLSPFSSEHLGAGDEVIVLERENRAEAAVAFRDSPVKGLNSAIARLNSLSLPLVLLSPQPKATVHRLSSQFGLEHAQGESGDAEAEQLCERLAAERLRPGWVQVSAFRPSRAAAVLALPAFGQDADLCTIDLNLPKIADAIEFARVAIFRLRSGFAWIFGSELALAGLTLAYSSHSRHPPSLHGLAIFGLLPGIVALLWAKPRPKACEESPRQEALA